MAQYRSDIEGLLQICKPMISCSDCKGIGSSELACCHIVCDGCCESHTCTASDSSNSRKCASPSFMFVKGLFEQLTRISSANITGNSCEKMDEAEINVSRKRHRRLPISKRSSSCEDLCDTHEGNNVLPSTKIPTSENGMKSLPSKSDGIKALSSKLLTHHEISNITIKVENEIDGYIKRYRSIQNNESALPEKSKTLNSEDMPKLERQDKYNTGSNFSTASHSVPDTLEAFDKNEESINGIARSKKKKLSESPPEVISNGNVEHCNFSATNEIKQELTDENEFQSIPTAEYSTWDDSFNIPNGSATEVMIEAISNNNMLHYNNSGSNTNAIPNGSADSPEQSKMKSTFCNSLPTDNSTVQAGPSKPQVRKKYTGSKKKTNSRQRSRPLTNSNPLQLTERVPVGNGGFNDFDELPAILRLIIFKMSQDKSSSGTGIFGNYEVIIKDKRRVSQNDQEPNDPLLQPGTSELQSVPHSSWQPIDDSGIPNPLTTIKIEENENDSLDPPPSQISLSELFNSHGSPQSSQHEVMSSDGTLTQDADCEEASCPSLVPRKKKSVIISDLIKNSSSQNSSGNSNIPNINGNVQAGGSRKDEKYEEIDDLICIERDNQVDESNHQVVSLATCNLSLREGALAIRLAKATKSQLRNSFTHETTHLILSQQNKENSIGSQDYLLAIAHGAFIVNFGWVEECLRENKILSPYGFIPKTEEGPCRCLETTNKPFSGFYFFMDISPPTTSHLDYVSFQVTKTLCLKGGARIIVDHEKFLSFVNRESICPRFYICCLNSELPDRIKAICERLKAVPLKTAWIIDSIKQYRALTILDYLYERMDEAVLCDHYNIPSHLTRGMN